MSTVRNLFFVAVSSAAVIVFQPAQAATIADDLSSDASVSIYLKGNPNGSQLPDLAPGVEQKIYLTDGTGVFTGFGNIGSNAACPVSGPCVNFTSSSLLDLSNGGATIKPNGTTYHDLTITVPGYTFGDFLFGVQLQKNQIGDSTPLYDLKITANGTGGELGHANLINPTVDNSGVLSFLVLANSTSITSLVLTSTFGIAGVYGFDQTKDFNISDVNPLCNDCAPPPSTPLPAAVWLMGTILAGGAGVRRWRRRRAARLTAA